MGFYDQAAPLGVKCRHPSTFICIVEILCIKWTVNKINSFCEGRISAVHLYPFSFVFPSSRMSLNVWLEKISSPLLDYSLHLFSYNWLILFPFLTLSEEETVSCDWCGIRQWKMQQCLTCIVWFCMKYFCFAVYYCSVINKWESEFCVYHFQTVTRCS